MIPGQLYRVPKGVVRIDSLESEGPLAGQVLYVKWPNGWMQGIPERRPVHELRNLLAEAELMDEKAIESWQNEPCRVCNE